MSQHRKMANFMPVAGDASLSAEFDCWHPDPRFGQNPQDAQSSWEGGALTAIKAEDGLRFVDLPKKLEHMIKHCWQAASVSAGAARGRVQLAGARQNPLDTMHKSFNPADVMQQARIKLAGARPVAPTMQPLAVDARLTRQTPHLSGIARDWKTHEQLERVNTYTFRGDSRAPTLIKVDGGFNPPISRTDSYYVDNVVFDYFQKYMLARYDVAVSKATFDRVYNENPAGSEERKVMNQYFVWRALVDNEAYHAGRMLACEALKGYISTSRAVPVARHFAKNNGWVYLTRVRGGFLIPDKGTTEWTKIFGEQEIALPAALKWSDIFGFRQVDNGRYLAGPVYLRRGFEAKNAGAFGQSFELLSGKPQ
jgi:hypothetical protein